MGGARTYAAGGLAGWLAGTSFIQLLVSFEPILDVNRLGSPLPVVLAELASRAVWVQSNFGPPFFLAAILSTWLFGRLRWFWAIGSALMLGVVASGPRQYELLRRAKLIPPDVDGQLTSRTSLGARGPGDNSLFGLPNAVP